MPQTRFLRLSFAPLLLSCLLLQACETTPVHQTAATPIPKDRIVALPSIESSVVDPAQLTITRDSGLFGSGPSILLAINGKKVAYFRTSEILTLTLAPGEYVVSIVPYPALGASPREYEIHLQPKAHSHYRISVTQGGVLFQRTMDGT